MNELAKCPFCGGEANMVSGVNWDCMIFVRCASCSGSMGYAYPDIEKATEAWNTRTSDANLEKCKELLGMLADCDYAMNTYIHPSYAKEARKLLEELNDE